MKNKFYVTVFFVLCTHLFVLAQKSNPNTAFEYLNNGLFELALTEYLSLLEDDTLNEKYLYRVGVCYLNTNINKAKAIDYFLKVIQLNGHLKNNSHYLLARAFHYNYEFDKAIEQYSLYLKLGGSISVTSTEIEKEIEYCYNAKELMKFPLSVSFENLGNQVNSIYQEYYPFIPIDESFLVYNSKKPVYENSKEVLDQNKANVFISRVQSGEFKSSELLPITIHSDIKEVVGLSPKGDYMLTYIEHKNKGDLYISHKNNFTQVEKLDAIINSDAHEIAASINNEGDMIYFASDRNGGYGGTDIYISKKLPNGKWGPPLNAGSNINTKYDEDFPNISLDGKTLYFSSKGHTSMGGYDIFASTYNDTTQSFHPSKNIGYPVNTVFDDMNFRLSKSGKYGYISALRNDSKGDYDIYRINFNDIETNYTVVKGKIITPNEEPISEIIIDVTENKNGELYGTYQPNFRTYKYIMILPPGKYNVYLESPGYKTIEETIEIFDKSSFVPEIIKDIYLQEEN